MKHASRCRKQLRKNGLIFFSKGVIEIHKSQVVLAKEEAAVSFGLGSNDRHRKNPAHYWNGLYFQSMYEKPRRNAIGMQFLRCLGMK